VINETLARRLWPGESPIGKRLSMMLESLRYFRDRAPEFDPALGMREVVGVVADAKRNGFSDTAPAEIYVPFAQRPVRDLTVVVGVQGDPAALTSAVRQAVAALDPEQPLGAVRTLEQIVDASVAQPRFNSMLVSSFALLALLLSAVGIYGVLSYVATERTRETGVRLALGAERSDIVRLMMVRGLRFTTTGVVVGLAGAAGVSVLLTRLLFGISAAEPLVYAGSAATVMLAAFAACYLPARRAARLDAVAALRHE
jgi:putative ABC transport system permease protein